MSILGPSSRNLQRWSDEKVSPTGSGMSALTRMPLNGKTLYPSIFLPNPLSSNQSLASPKELIKVASGTK